MSVASFAVAGLGVGFGAGAGAGVAYGDVLGGKSVPVHGVPEAVAP